MGTLTKRQTDFILYYVESRNIFQSALLAGYSASYAKSRSHELLQNPPIKEHITHLTETYYKEKFQELAYKSIKELTGVIEDSENRSSQLQAIKYVLSQAGVAEQSDSQAGVIEIIVPGAGRLNAFCAYAVDGKITKFKINAKLIKIESNLLSTLIRFFCINVIIIIFST